MTILDDLANEELFGPFFRGSSWGPWFTFLKTLFAVEMTEPELEAFRHHTGRFEPSKTPYREAALICGRRAGKSRILATIAVFLAMRDYAPFLAPGERATIPIVAADRKQARTIFRYVMGLIDGIPALATIKGTERDDFVELGEHVVIEIHTASYRGVRGYTLAACLIDEVAFLRDEASANPDEEILAAVRPGLSSIPGAILLMGSSPYAKRGALYSAFRQHWGKDSSRVLVFRGTSLEMNPTLDPEVVREAYEADPARASSEFGAEFRDDVIGFVTREVVEACICPGRHELPPISGVRYHAFVDPSGGSADSMTLAIAHTEKDAGILDAVREIRPPFSPEGVVKDFVDLLKQYRIREVTGDRYAGEWPREQFRKLGVEYKLSDRPASDIFRDILPRLNSHQVELLDLPRIEKQFVDLERRTARGGKDNISHPPGGHDDLVVSISGALLMCRTRQPMRISAEMLRLSAIRPGSYEEMVENNRLNERKRLAAEQER